MKTKPFNFSWYSDPFLPLFPVLGFSGRFAYGSFWSPSVDNMVLQLVLKETFSLYEKRFFGKFKGLHEYNTEKWGMSC